jgi:hypothetical protein
MPSLPTWDGRSQFSYTGSVAQGTEIIYGNRNKINVSATQYSSLLSHFRGSTVEIGTSHTEPPRNSLGAWMLDNITKTGIASYVGPILIHAGFAQKVARTQIKFL